MPAEDLSTLLGLQKSFQSAVQGKVELDNLMEIVRGPGTMDSEQGINIYRRMYQLRIRDALLDDFEACAEYLKDDFNILCRDFIKAHPSTTYTLSYLGRGFAEFLLDWSRKNNHPEWLSEVAKFEHAMAESLVAQAAAVIDSEWLQTLPPETLTRAQLKLSPHVHLLELSVDVASFYELYKADKQLTAPAKQVSHILVYSLPRSVRYEELEPEGYKFLSALRTGDTLEGAVDRIFPNASTEQAQKVFQWLSSWMARGIFCEIKTP